MPQTLFLSIITINYHYLSQVLIGTMNAGTSVTCKLFPMQGYNRRRAYMALDLTESPASASAIPRTRRGPAAPG